MRFKYYDVKLEYSVQLHIILQTQCHNSIIKNCTGSLPPSWRGMKLCCVFSLYLARKSHLFHSDASASIYITRVDWLVWNWMAWDGNIEEESCLQFPLLLESKLKISFLTDKKQKMDQEVRKQNEILNFSILLVKERYWEKNYCQGLNEIMAILLKKN